MTQSLGKEDATPDQELDVVIGWVAPVGTEIEKYETALARNFRARGFATSDPIKLIEFGRNTAIGSEDDFDSPDYFKRTRGKQEAGNKLRQRTSPGILGAFAVRQIQRFRASTPGHRMSTIHSLKHHAEAILLRQVYGASFFLIGVHGVYETRLNYLTKKCGGDADQARALMDHDDYETAEYGQKTREVFELCDGYLQHGSPNVNDDLERLLDLFFGAINIPPKIDEYGMSLAYQAATRSGDLARQVGAAILTPQGETIASGRNDVPKAGGGLYSVGEAYDASDYAIGVDMGQQYRDQLIGQVTNTVEEAFVNNYGAAERITATARLTKRLGAEPTDDQVDARVLRWKKRRIKVFRAMLAKTSLRDLIEYGRSVHAEMDALLTCARNGIPVKGATLFSTTFPCHTCARHIIAAGIRRVVYLEPYPKSQAMNLHSDSIDCAAMQPRVLSHIKGEVIRTFPPIKKVKFSPLVGVAPRRFSEFFAMRTHEGVRVERKSKGQALDKAHGDDGHLRVMPVNDSLLDREKSALRLLGKE